MFIRGCAFYCSLCGSLSNILPHRMRYATGEISGQILVTRATRRSSAAQDPICGWKILEFAPSTGDGFGVPQAARYAIDDMPDGSAGHSSHIDARRGSLTPSQTCLSTGRCGHSSVDSMDRYGGDVDEYQPIKLAVPVNTSLNAERHG
ncbi:hypothetical protein BKA93DRAFT_99566 [Sparassis latifolia]